MKNSTEKSSFIALAFFLLVGFTSCADGQQKSNTTANNAETVKKIDNTTETRGYLGIGLVPEEQEDAKLEEWGLSNKAFDGVLILDIDPNGSAVKVGIKEKDIVISINDVAVQDGADLATELEKYKPNDKINVAVLRNGKRYEYNILLETGTDSFMKQNSKITE